MTWFMLVFPVILLSTLYVWLRIRKQSYFPPSPRGIPLLGNVISIGPKPHLTMLKWGKQYGDIYMFYMCRSPVVVLNDFNTVRKVFGEDAVSGRPTDTLIRNADSMLPLGKGLIFSEGHLWKTHRRFALSTLKDLGMGKNWLEKSILAEVETLCQAFRDTNQRPFNPKVQVSISVSNTVCALIFGKTFPLTDPKFSWLTGLTRQHFENIQYDFIAMTLPFIMWFPNAIRTKILSARQAVKGLGEFLQETVNEHDQQQTRQGTGIPDYINAYRKEKESGLKVSEQDTFSDEQLLVSLHDLFAAGTETVSTTILWFFVFMIENPDVMSKVQSEIDSITGRDKTLTIHEKSLLPYTEAVILETQRFASMHPVGAPHRNPEEMEINGYTIPKGSRIVANLFGIHHDTRWWKNPYAFDPERFLDENRQIIRPDGFAPFLVGKRACPGEALAKMELFLFIANILRSFTLVLPPGRTLSHKDNEMGITLTPSPYELIFVPRF